MKNAGMAGAVALVGIGLITIGLGNFVKAPVAVAAAPAPVAVEQGPEEPVIVAFGSIGSTFLTYDNVNRTGFYRVWSDARIELRLLELREARDLICSSDGSLLVQERCNPYDDSLPYIPQDTGWIELPESPNGEGFACRADTNGDRRVDGIDLATVLAQWGDGVSCDPQPSYPCFELGNLNLPAGALK